MRQTPEGENSYASTHSKRLFLLFHLKPLGGKGACPKAFLCHLYDISWACPEVLFSTLLTVQTRHWPKHMPAVLHSWTMTLEWACNHILHWVCKGMFLPLEGHMFLLSYMNMCRSHQENLHTSFVWEHCFENSSRVLPCHLRQYIFLHSFLGRFFFLALY